MTTGALAFGRILRMLIRMASKTLTPPPAERLTAALATFAGGFKSRGERYFQKGFVLEGTADGSGYWARVRNESNYVYSVTLWFESGDFWCECTCPVGSYCKHGYAALRHWQEALEEVDPIEPTGFAAWVQPGHRLSKADRAFITHLERLYERHQLRSPIYAEDVRLLSPAIPPSENWQPLRFAPEGKLTREEFWHFLLRHLGRSHPLRIPTYFGSKNDVAPTEARILEWEEEKAAQEWLRRLEGVPGHWRERHPTELRMALAEGSKLRLEVRSGSAGPFRAVRGGELRTLGDEVKVDAIELNAPSALVWSEWQRATPAYYAEKPVLDLTATLAARLHPFLTSTELAGCLVGDGGEPLPRDPRFVTWRFEVDPVRPKVYRAELLLAGERLVSPVGYFPGKPPFYWVQGRLHEGEVPPFPVDAFTVPVELEIPQTAVESVPGVRFLRRIGRTPLPARLQARVVERPPQGRIRVEAVRDTFSGQTLFFVYPETVDPETGVVVKAYGETHWTANGAEVQQDGERFLVYGEPDLSAIDAAMARLPVTYDRSAYAWRVRQPKRSAEILAGWLATLPPGLPVILPKGSEHLGEPPVEVAVRLDCEPGDRDWFNLQLRADGGAIQLSAEEVEMLLRSRQATLRRAEDGNRAVQLRLDPALEGALQELGIDAADLVAHPERLHLLQLAALADAKLLPKGAAESIRTRMATIRTQVEPEVPAGVRTTLRPYQVQGFHFLSYLSANGFGGILADDMGLGKTLQALTWLVSLYDAGAEGLVLVVCPKSVMTNWVLEAGRAGIDLPAAIAGGVADRPDTTSEGPKRGLWVINYAQLRLMVDGIANLPWLAVVFDEGQNLKNPQAQTAKAARRLNARHKVALTGTPIENRLLDLWSLLHCVMPGALGTQARFKRAFDDAADPDARRRVSRRVRPFLLRRTKEEVALELPPKVEEEVYCALEGRQRRLYDAELKLAQARLLTLRTAAALDQERFHLLTSLLRLRQICCHPALVDPDGEHGEAAKFDALAEILDTTQSEGQKVLVFSQFVELLNLTERFLKGRNLPLYSLTGKTKKRQETIDAFQADPNPAVFLISLKAGGTGLNLTSAAYVVLLDPWWNPAVENQAIDRAHRMGQRETVFAYRLVARDTIEEKIRLLQREKSQLARDVLGEEAFGQALTLTDFQFLLGK